MWLRKFSFFNPLRELLSRNCPRSANRRRAATVGAIPHLSGWKQNKASYRGQYGIHAPLSSGVALRSGAGRFARLSSRVRSPQATSSRTRCGVSERNFSHRRVTERGKLNVLLLIRTVKPLLFLLSVPRRISF